jgi:hypothetical protein
MIEAAGSESRRTRRIEKGVFAALQCKAPGSQHGRYLFTYVGFNLAGIIDI